MTGIVRQAVIMAGGEGSRLRPLTSNVPKPMLPVANVPMMEHIIELLKSHGITEIVATVQFLSSVIRNYFGDGSDLDVQLSYATEEVPLGTAGSVWAARDLLSGPFLVISGDALTDLDLNAVTDFHRSKGAAATIVLKRVPDPLEFGIVMTADDGRIERFLEKPGWGQVFSDTINTGIYVLEPEILDLIPPDEPYDFSSQLFPAMLDKGLPLYGFITDDYWTDVGNTDAFLEAQGDVLRGEVDVAMAGFELMPGVRAGEDVDIHPTARLTGPVLIGDNSRIGPAALVGPGTVIGDNAIVGPDSVVAQSVIMDGAHVGPYARTRGAIIGRGVSLERGAAVEEGAVLGDEVRIGAGAIVKPRVRIYPSRTVEAGAIVTHSVVHERTVSRSLFGPRGVSGQVNLAVTPQTAVRLGMAYGTTLKRGSVVVTGRDSSRAARTMKRALIAGLNAAGVTCHDLELIPMPVTRYTVRSEQAAGGAGVRTSPGDPEIVEMRLFDEDGADLTQAAQRKIERIFFREDYRRVAPSKLGELEFPPRAVEQYTSGLLRALDLPAIRQAELKVVVDYAFGAHALIGPSFVGRLGCEALALHAFTDEHRPVLVTEDLERLLEEVAQHVRNSGADLGVLLEPGGDMAHLVDDRGRVVSHDRAFLAFAQHSACRNGAEAIALPVSTPSAAERIASGTRIEWTALSSSALMEGAARPGVAFAGDAQGALIFPDFMPAPDALMTFGKALEMVAASGSLAEMIDALPPSHVVRRDVATPWELKGAVMRRVSSSADPGHLVLVDGVKVVESERRWALVVPLPDEPTTRIWAEGEDESGAEEIAARYASVVSEVVAEGQDRHEDL